MNMIKTAIKMAFKERKYKILAFGIFVVLFVFASWLSNISLIIKVMKTSGVTFFEKLSVLVALFASIGTNFTLFAVFYTFIIAVLFGMNVAMLAYYMKKNKELSAKSGATSMGGLVSGVFGVGCASCGTLIIGPLLTLFGAGGILAYFPFGGQEFGVFGVLMLLASVYLISKKISKPAICKDMLS